MDERDGRTARPAVIVGRLLAAVQARHVEPRLTLLAYACAMSSEVLSRLSAADRLRLLAFDAELRGLPQPFLEALWAGVDALESRQRPTANRRGEMRVRSRDTAGRG